MSTWQRAILSVLILFSVGVAGAETFPEKPITLVCGFPPGAAADAHLRALARAMSKVLGQAVIVDNKAGAAGTLAASMVVNGAADGYTLVQVTNNVIRQPFVAPTNFDPVKSFTYVIGVSAFDFGLVVNTSSPWNTFSEFSTFAKQNPGKVTYGTIGVGSLPHQVMERVGDKLGIDWTHIAYKGSSPAQLDLQGGHITAASDTGWAPLVDGKKLRALAVYGNKRLKHFPNVPTLTELGFDIVEDAPWGLAAPKAVPAERIKVIHDAARKALDDPEFLASLDTFAHEVRYLDTQQYQSYMAGRVVAEKEIVQKYNLQQK